MAHCEKAGSASIDTSSQFLTFLLDPRRGAVGGAVGLSSVVFLLFSSPPLPPRRPLTPRLAPVRTTVVVMGYSPLGSSFDRHPEAHGTTLLKNPIVNEIATVRSRKCTRFHASTSLHCTLWRAGRRLASQPARC